MNIRSCLLSWSLFILAFFTPVNVTAESFLHPHTIGKGNKYIALTIDDLPFVGEYRNFHLNMIIESMQKAHITATGFIIAKEVRKDNWSMLHKFRDAGFTLGNHTLTHADLSKLSRAQYSREIQEADTLLQPVMTKPKYFRFPYLAMSSGQKKEDILCLLAQKKYRVAPITIDSKDFVFNQRLLAVPEMQRRAYLEELKPFYLDFIWQQTHRAEEKSTYQHQPDQAQILLIHANLLNAYVLPDIIKLYQENGYQFISLQKALTTFKHIDRCAKPQLYFQPQLHLKNDKEIEAFVDWD
ncbi:MAG: polysaccharide deacetylase [Legionella sp. 40-6]|nr:polysaccharide deacetylase family protein [Legionella sp.]OJY33157.1 MAG: polysaccharide deacetylase [Legionella sp. 40-6]